MQSAMKTARLFLIRDGLNHERLWQRFFTATNLSVRFTSMRSGCASAEPRPPASDLPRWRDRVHNAAIGDGSGGAIFVSSSSVTVWRRGCWIAPLFAA
jgi:hypothetical protein